MGIDMRTFRRLLVVAFVAMASAGCPQYADPTAPNPVRRLHEPFSDSEYLIYVPSRYRADQAAPLVVICHGTFPFDSAERQIRDWIKLAEEKNFIAVAPKLKGVRGDFPPPAAKQVELQKQDEATILGTVRAVQGAYNIRPDRIFMNGWSAGNFAVLYTGLRHPHIFRALAVLQGNFNSAYMSDVNDHVDPYQPVFVLFGSLDFLADQGRECVEWLYDHNAYVFQNEVPGYHRAHPREAFDFFARVVGEIPWLHVQPYAVDPTKPLTVKFTTRSSFEPMQYHWDFGDGENSPVAEPEHTYASPGRYRVTLVAFKPDRRQVTRILEVDVPQAKIEHDLID